MLAAEILLDPWPAMCAWSILSCLPEVSEVFWRNRAYRDMSRSINNAVSVCGRSSCANAFLSMPTNVPKNVNVSWFAGSGSCLSCSLTAWSNQAAVSTTALPLPENSAILSASAPSRPALADADNKRSGSVSASKASDTGNANSVAICFATSLASDVAVGTPVSGGVPLTTGCSPSGCRVIDKLCHVWYGQQIVCRSYIEARKRKEVSAVEVLVVFNFVLSG